jgi:hypothetical protein
VGTHGIGRETKQNKKSLKKINRALSQPPLSRTEAETWVRSKFGSTYNPLPWPRKALLLEV